MSFDPLGGAKPSSPRSLTFTVPATAGPRTDLTVDLQDLGGGTKLCERQFVRFDHFSVTLVQAA